MSLKPYALHILLASLHGRSDPLEAICRECHVKPPDKWTPAMRAEFDAEAFRCARCGYWADAMGAD